MGISRVVYSRICDHISLYQYMCGCGFLCLVSYLLAALSPSPLLGLIGCALCGLSVGVMWPAHSAYLRAAFQAAARRCSLSSALAGDVGCAGGPSLVGFISGQAGGNMKAGTRDLVFFPILLIVTLLFLMRRRE